MKRIVVLVLMAAAVWSAENGWLNLQQGESARRLAVAQLNGGDPANRALRRFDTVQDLVPTAAMLLLGMTALWALAPVARAALARTRALKRLNRGVALAALAALPLLGGCKPYDRPEYVEIDTSETGFLIPLEGDTTQQAKFQSEDYLRQRKVAAKRVQILHRWSQQGRLGWDGQWIPTVRLVKVVRSPLTREWMSGDHRNAEGQRRPDGRDQAIWIESADSVGFSMGFTCTGFIAEEDASKFLYWYPSGTLADVMDREVRGRIQQSAAEVAAKYPLDQLRSRKQEISDAVKQDLTNYFAGRGITVTTVGMFGGMTYENPAIQKSIDETFIAQQLKVISAAKFEAQQKENDRIQLEAEGMAVKARQEALGLADARRTAAEAEAAAIREINNAAREAQNNPLLLQLKSLEVEKARVEKWDGRYPQTWFGAGAAGGPNVLFQVPAPPTAVASK
jgi:SPFH domain / Band 7 family